MKFWKRLIKVLSADSREQPVERHTFALEARLEQSLRRVAAEENRPPDEILNVLIEAGLEKRRQNEEAWLCWRALTPREQDVAALMCLHYTNRQIAARLGIAPDTVKTHARNLLTKFGVRSRNDLREILADWDFSAWGKQAAR